MELVCIKGIGKTHAKWSPVCTAYYRLKPDVRITEPILNEDAVELKQMCPDMFDIEELGGGKKRAVLSSNTKAWTNREPLRHEKFVNKIDMGRWKDIFEFTVESIGIYTPVEIVVESLGKLKAKASYWLQVLKSNEEQGLMTQD